MPTLLPIRNVMTEAVFDLDPSGNRIEAALRAGLQKLGPLSAEEFLRALPAAEAAHAVLSALS